MTQKQRLLEWLMDGQSISPLKAWRKLGIYRLAAVIHLLRKDGYEIRTDAVTVKNQFGEDCTVAKYTLDLEYEAEQRRVAKAELLLDEAKEEGRTKPVPQSELDLGIRTTVPWP